MKQTKISKSARGKACTARIPGAGIHDPATTILAHAPFTGRFGSRKHWWWSAYLCFECHELLDDRDMRLTRDEKDLIWFSAVHETQTQLFESNLLKVV